VEGSEITSESVSKASERLWFRLHTAPWFKPFRSAGVLLVGKTTQGLFAVIYTALAARALGLEAFGALVLLHGFIMAVADLARFQSWQIVLRYGAPALNAGDTSRFRRVLEFSVLLDLLGAGIGLVVVLLTVAPAMRLFGLPVELQALAPYYSAGILFLPSVGTSHGVLRLLDRFDLIAIQSAIAPATRLVGSAVLYLAGANLEAFLVV
jgi:O-antigen/teichoic acid export membrane protein